MRSLYQRMQNPPLLDTFLSFRRRPPARLYLVRFHDGLRSIDRNVVAFSRAQARTLAEPTVPPEIYGKWVVFLYARLLKSLPLTIDDECLQLLTEKAANA